jgi:hypothetical protein
MLQRAIGDPRIAGLRAIRQQSTPCRCVRASQNMRLYADVRAAASACPLVTEAAAVVALTLDSAFLQSPHASRTQGGVDGIQCCQ